MIRSHVVHIFHVKKRFFVSKFIDQNHTLISNGCSPVDSREKNLIGYILFNSLQQNPKGLHVQFLMTRDSYLLWEYEVIEMIIVTTPIHVLSVFVSKV